MKKGLCQFCGKSSNALPLTDDMGPSWQRQCQYCTKVNSHSKHK